jgi:hypothetical protein
MYERKILFVLLFSSIVLAQTLEENTRNFNRIQIYQYGFFDLKPLSKLKIDYSKSISFDPLRNLVFCGSDNKVYIIDVSNPINPYKIPVEIHTKGPIEKLFYDHKNQTLYIAESEQGIEIWSIKKPSDVENIGRYITSERAMSVYVSAPYAYVADWDAGLRIVNILNPANPIEVGHYDSPGYCCDIFVLNSYAYIADWDEGIRIIDISNPSLPREVGFYDTPGYCWNICVKDSYAYVADDYAGFRIINVSNPSNPYEMSCCDIDGFVDKVVVADSHLFVLNSLKGLLMFNSFNFSNIYGGYCYEGPILDCYVANGYIFLTDGYNLMIYNSSVEKNKERNIDTNPKINFISNPVKNKVMFKLEHSKINELIFLLYNALGQMVRKYHINISEKEYLSFDVSGIPPGVYFFRLKEGRRSEVKKVLIIE